MEERERGAGRPVAESRSEVDTRSERLPRSVERPEEVSAEEARHERAMISAERVMRKHRNVFAALAK